MLFPEFQPPPTHARSRSMSTPRRIRFSAAARRLQTVYCLTATRLKADGITQLTVPGLQGQPYLSGLKRTSRSVILNFQRQNQSPSLPRSRTNQFRALSLELDIAFSEIRVDIARPVVHVPSVSPKKDGQLPSESWQFIRNRDSETPLP